MLPALTLLYLPGLPVPQITAEEYRAAREELRSVDARPIKKVVEAQARKRHRLQMRLTQVRVHGVSEAVEI